MGKRRLQVVQVRSGWNEAGIVVATLGKEITAGDWKRVQIPKNVRRQIHNQARAKGLKRFPLFIVIDPSSLNFSSRAAREKGADRTLKCYERFAHAREVTKVLELLKDPDNVRKRNEAYRAKTVYPENVAASDAV